MTLIKTRVPNFEAKHIVADYIEKEKFEEAEIALHWMEYGPYPEYPQLYPPFEHGVSVLDMLFSLGEKAPSYIW